MMGVVDLDFGLFAVGQKALPVIALNRGSDMQHTPGTLQGPTHSAAFHPVFHQVTAGSFDHA